MRGAPRRAGLVAIASVVLALGPAGAAFATTTTVTFDSFAPGTALSTVGNATFVGSPTVFTPVHVATSSPPRALHSANSCASSPTTCYLQEVDFSTPVSQVSLRVGLDDEAAGEIPTPYQLTAYNASNAIVAQSDGTRTLATGFDPITTPVAVQSLHTDIVKVVLSTGATTVFPYNSGYARRVDLDDLTYTDDSVVAPPAPSVTISLPTPSESFLRPGDVHVWGEVSAPAGVTHFCLTTSSATTIPANCNDSTSLLADGSFRNLSVAGLAPGPNTITAWAEDSQLRIAHASVTINIASIDLSATNLEVTQAIQDQLPVVNAPTDGARTASYNGVTLAAGRPTVARFWVGVDLGGTPGRLGGVHALLYGFRDGTSLGPPVTPIEGDPVLDPSNSVLPPGPSIAQWSDPSSQAFTFRLPTSWEQGTVTLIAEVNPPGSATTLTECAGCDADNGLTLSGVPFAPVRSQRIFSLAMVTTGSDGTVSEPAPSWGDLQTLYPFTTDVDPYQGMIDITDGLSVPPGMGQQQRDTRQAMAIGKLLSWVDAYPGPIDGHVIAMSDGQDLGLTSTVGCCFHHVPKIAQVEDTRSLTSVPHEYGHELGLAHAGTQGPDTIDPNPSGDRACGGDSNGQHGSDWPPDQTGLLQGVGTDPRVGSGGSAGTLRIIGLQAPDGTPLQNYDFMSYCAHEDTAWISVRNWNRLIHDYAGGIHRSADSGNIPSSSSGVIGGPFRTAPNHGPALRVTAVIGADHLTRILDVAPSTGRTIKPSGSSPVTLKLEDRAGRVVSSTPVPVTTGHMDKSEPFILVDAIVPAPHAARLELVYQGHVLATRHAPARAASVRLLSLRRHHRIPGKGFTVVRWRVHNPAHSKTTETIDYSRNGRTYKPIVAGIHGTSFRVPDQMLTRSRRGRIRVGVSDGWNEARAVSGKLRVAGPAARASITEPLPDARIAGDATFVASGQASDDRGRPMTGHELRWFDGARYLGSGADITVHGMSPGRRHLRLVTVADGHRASTAVPVTVTRARPSFTELRIPARLAADRRSLRIVAASSVGGVLQIGHRRARIGVWPRSIRIPVSPGRRRLRLTMTLRTFVGSERVRRTVARR
jgi:hypothetical protein